MMLAIGGLLGLCLTQWLHGPMTQANFGGFGPECTEVAMGGAGFLVPTCNRVLPDGAQIEDVRTPKMPPWHRTRARFCQTVATSFCAGRGQNLDSLALGAFVGGNCVFDGGCV